MQIKLSPLKVEVLQVLHMQLHHNIYLALWARRKT